jgi:hypothetical protein
MTPAALTLDHLGAATDRPRARGDRPRDRGERLRERGDRKPPREPAQRWPSRDEPGELGFGFGDEPNSPAETSRPAPPSTGHAAHRELTLDELLSTTWDSLTAHQTVTCPVCTGAMAPRYGSGALPVGGRCRRCGTSLG